MHGDDDQIVPFPDSAPLPVKLVKKGTLKVCPGYPHGMCTTNADVIHLDLLIFHPVVTAPTRRPSHGRGWIGEGNTSSAVASGSQPKGLY